MAFKLTKTNHRHKAYSIFDYYVVPDTIKYREVVNSFTEWRKWAWESWGPSNERDFIWTVTDPLWSWHVDVRTKAYRIYLKSDKELNWFTLRWG